MDVDGGNTNNHTLTGLINGETYTISIVGTSSSSGVLPSAPVSAGTVVGLGNLENRPIRYWFTQKCVNSFYESPHFPTCCFHTYTVFWCEVRILL